EILHVGDVDVGRQQLRLVGAGLRQMAVDDREDLLGLFGGALAPGLVGDDAREIDGVAVDDDLAHARPGFKTLNAHWVLRLKLAALPSLSRGCALLPCAHGKRLKNAQIVSAPSMSW